MVLKNAIVASVAPVEVDVAILVAFQTKLGLVCTFDLALVAHAVHTVV